MSSSSSSSEQYEEGEYESKAKRMKSGQEDGEIDCTSEEQEGETATVPGDTASYGVMLYSDLMRTHPPLGAHIPHFPID